MRVKFIDLLYTLPPETYVFIENLEESQKERSAQAKPCKAENLKFRDIQNWRDLDVYRVEPCYPFRRYQKVVLYIQIGDKTRVERRLDIWDVLGRREKAERKQ